MRGLLTIGLIVGLLLSTTAMGAGGVLSTGATDAHGTVPLLPLGTELSDEELSQVTGEFLPVWAAVGVVLVARIAAKAIITAIQGATVGAQAGAIHEIGRQIVGGHRPDPLAVACAAAGGALAGAVTGLARNPGAAPAVGGAFLGGAAAGSCSR